MQIFKCDYQSIEIRHQEKFPQEIKKFYSSLYKANDDVFDVNQDEQMSDVAADQLTDTNKKSLKGEKRCRITKALEVLASLLTKKSKCFIQKILAPTKFVKCHK